MLQTRIVCSAAVGLEEHPGVALGTFAGRGQLASASALVLCVEDALSADVVDCVAAWGTPLFVLHGTGYAALPAVLADLQPTLLQVPLSAHDIARVVETAKAFDLASLPPFTSAVAEFVSRKRPTFACPGHQGGQCLDLHPAGLRFKQLLGSEVFKVDVPHAAPELGDVLSHEGPVAEAERLAAEVFNADETYFVLNGTSTANKVVTSALLAAGDLVLMDRNNHKSVYLGALVQSAARPVYLDNFRDGCGVLGGYKRHALDEQQLRLKAARIDPSKARQQRPFRLAVVQHATCDGVVVDAAALLQRIGHLCDYVLFDSAWLGYEPFVELLAQRSPLNIALTADCPGIIVTQSVHKQMSGLSQTSQIHKKDSHIRNQPRYCSRSVFNSAFMLHASTSPFYPLLMSLEVNAAIHANGNGKRAWSAAVAMAMDFRREVAQRCRVIQPYYGDRRLPAGQGDTSLEVYAQVFQPVRHETLGASPIESDLHYLDPCKVIFTTRKLHTGEQGGLPAIPASIVTAYLREMNFTPEKSDFYNVTLLVSPSTEAAQLSRLAHALAQLEQMIEGEVPVAEALPSLASGQARYNDLSLRELCCAINTLFSQYQIEQLQSDIFSSVTSAQAELTPYAAQQAFIRGNYQLVALEQALGCIAAEGVIPYPPGVMCIAPGERWNSSLIRYLSAIEALSNQYPEFAPHIQGVYQCLDNDASVSLQVHVLATG
ncbi:ornithine decarboxylase [Pseudomonas vranovensis]|uniref:Orn/Lys/Arg family decarboxylase n=1 Tax=Pseudomonas vranovensis TaxID=321661 RepID=UPI003D99D25A